MKKVLMAIIQVVFFTTSLYGQNAMKVMSTYSHNGNIYIRFSNNSVKQLTFSNADSHPFVLAKQHAIVFVRNTYCDVENTKAKKIMIVNWSNLLEKTLVSEKPEQDGYYLTNCLITVVDPTLSTDERYLYFITEAYATSGGLVKVDLETGRWISLFGADSYELIKSGEYASLLLVAISEIKDKGRAEYYYLVNEKCEVLKEFETEQNYLQFKKSIGLK